MDREYLYQIIITLGIYIFIRVVIFYYRRRKRFQLFKHYNIPGPEPRLLIGSQFVYKNHTAKHVTDQYLSSKYGKTFGVFLGDEPIILSTDLELLKDVFLGNYSSFKERPKNFYSTPLDHSILFATNQRWKVMRRAMTPNFRSYKIRGSESMEFVENTIKLMLDYIDGKFGNGLKSDESKDRIELNILELFKATALNMISSMAINLPDVQVRENDPNVSGLDSFLGSFGGLLDDLVMMFPISKQIISKLSGLVYKKRFALVLRGLETSLENQLRKLRQTKDHSAYDKDTKLMNLLAKQYLMGKLSREEVLANGVAILIAGYDTTSTTLAYVFWLLGNHSEVQERLRADLKIYGIDSEYLELVLNECMRLYPAVILFTSRMATKTIECNNVTIPQGARVIYNSWLVHRDPEIWPDPLRFDPERFRQGKQNIHPCAFAPFGLGERKCLGFHLALLKLKMIICEILLRYRVSTIAPTKLEPVTYSIALSKPNEKIIVSLERV